MSQCFVSSRGCCGGDDGSGDGGGETSSFVRPLSFMATTAGSESG